MSYILDALRKADAERDRGNVPDLHAQPVPHPLPGSSSPARSGPWAAVAVGALVVAAGAVGWALLGRDAPREVAPAPAPTVVFVPAPPPLPTPVQPRAAPAPAARAPAPVSAQPAAGPVARRPAAATSAVVTTEPGRAAEPRVYALAELPDDIRRELPTLAVGGAMYSETAANRMLIINGQVFHERDKLAPNLTLVQIKLKSAVLEFRGYRYSIAF